MSNAVKEGSVVAFEPQPLLADYLRKVVRSLGISNVTIENMGVSSVVGVMDLNIPGPVETSPSASLEKSVHSDGEFQSYEVSVTTLDDYFVRITQQIGAIKIDVEGHELSVLQGAEKIIKHHSSLIICDSESRHLPNGDVKESIESFRKIG
ncbi:MAG: FkbM family methyltransferase [Opitutae bacterium]|jgi:FkbM family methyltransferase|nr:FkbM family methyltransferase [Opitutae bacterium]